MTESLEKVAAQIEDPVCQGADGEAVVEELRLLTVQQEQEMNVLDPESLPVELSPLKGQSRSSNGLCHGRDACSGIFMDIAEIKRVFGHWRSSYAMELSLDPSKAFPFCTSTSAKLPSGSLCASGQGILFCGG